LVDFPQIVDNPERISYIAILALTAPAKDFTTMRHKFLPGSFKVFDEQLHHRAADFFIFDDEQIKRMGIMIAECRIVGAIFESEHIGIESNRIRKAIRSHGHVRTHREFHTATPFSIEEFDFSKAPFLSSPINGSSAYE
jgi:hypothetical protein